MRRRLTERFARLQAGACALFYFWLVVGGLLPTTPEARGGDWPRWRGPHLNGISDEKQWTTAWPKGGPKQLWKAEVGTGFSSVAVADGRLFTMGNANDVDTVYCFDAETGRELWKHSYPCPLEPIYYEGGPGSTPTVEAGRVYTLSKGGHLFCFNASNGEVIWKKNLVEELKAAQPRWGFAGSPLILDELLLLNAGTSGTAVAKETGKVIWSSGTNAAGYATPIPFTSGGDLCVALFANKALFGVRVRDGRQLWEHAWETKWDINAADPIPIGGALFVSTFDRGCALLSLGRSRPSVAWENKNIGNHFNSCVYLDGCLYGVDGNTDQRHKDLRCLDAKTGAVKWTYDGLGLGSLMAAGGKLIVLSERGELLVAKADPAGFKPLARAQVIGGKCWTVPVLANGRIYCRNAQGTLVCLDVKGSP